MSSRSYSRRERKYWTGTRAIFSLKDGSTLSLSFVAITLNSGPDWRSGKCFFLSIHFILLREEEADPSFDSRRAYPLPKIQENNTAEIMEVVLNDARDSYAEEIVVELQSESPEQMEENVSRIVSWVEAWKQNNTDEEE